MIDFNQEAKRINHQVINNQIYELIQYKDD